MIFKSPTAENFSSPTRDNSAQRDTAARAAERAHHAQNDSDDTPHTRAPNITATDATTNTSTDTAHTPAHTRPLTPAPFHNAEKLLQALCVCLGGAAGVLARFCVCENLGYAAATILLCNISGSFLMGFASRLRDKLGKNITAFLTAGFCGGFTVFAGVAKFAAQKSASGEFGICAIDIISNLAFCIFAAFLGYKLGGTFTRPPRNAQPEKRK